jgi:hypothetical protein
MSLSTRAIAVAIAAEFSLFGAVAMAAPSEPTPAASVAAPAPEPAIAPTPAAVAPSPSVAPPGSVVSAASGSPPGTTSATLHTESLPAPMAETPPTAKPLVPEWLNGVTLGAGVLLWYYQPIVPRAPSVENNVSVFWARLLVDGKRGIFGFHLEPRFRDSPLRSTSTTVNGANVLTYTQNDHAWLQEAYASVDLEALHAQLKIGKEYSHLGYFWDNSFYGNIQVYDGLKLDPDYGASLEGAVGKSDDPLGLGYWAQYFVVDGSTNVSLPGRDTISVPGARRRNQTIVRLEPRLNVGGATAALGLSGEYLQADLPTIGPQNVWRAAVDATLTYSGAKILAELQHQDGRNVTDFPLVSTPTTPGSSANVDHAQIGGEYTYGAVTGRYNASLGSYNNIPLATGGTITIKEWLHVIGVGVVVSPNVSVLGELVFWERDTPTSSALVDRSFNVTVHAHL